MKQYKTFEDLPIGTVIKLKSGETVHVRNKNDIFGIYVANIEGTVHATFYPSEKLKDVGAKVLGKLDLNKLEEAVFLRTEKLFYHEVFVRTTEERLDLVNEIERLLLAIQILEQQTSHNLTV